MGECEYEIKQRVTGSMAGILERPLLLRLAGAMPGWVSPDMLTALGFSGALMTFVGYVLCHGSRQFLWLASSGIAVNWFGDSLDGTLARVRLAERRRYGFLIDHITDLGSQILIGLGAGLSPFFRLDVACIAVIAYLSFMAFSLMTAPDPHRLRIAYGGIGPTEVRIGIIFLNVLLIWYRPGHVVTSWGTFSAIDITVLSASAFAFAALFVAALRAVRRAAQDEG